MFLGGTEIVTLSQIAFFREPVAYRDSTIEGLLSNYDLFRDVAIYSRHL